MKRLILVSILLCLAFPANALSVEVLGVKIGENSLYGDQGDIIVIAKDYIGYTATRNRKELQSKLKIDPVHTPWCAGFINYILDEAGYISTDDLSASSFHTYGTRTKQPIPGDIVLLRRNGGSGRHVGFFFSYAYNNGIKTIRVLGGNQNDGVNIREYPASLVVEFRRPIPKVPK